MAKNDKKGKTKPKAKAKAKAKKAPKKEVVVRSADELMADAKKFIKEQTTAPYKRIKKVLEVTPSGRPARVVVECSDPQKNGSDESICDKTREIAIQDLFQVVRCISCQKRSVQLYRNELAKKRRKELAASRKGKKAKK